MEELLKEPPVRSSNVISADILLRHWQGHRGLTRRMIEAFPEDKLFTYSVGGMRPFGELVMEMLHMAAPGLKGVVTGSWPSFDEAAKSMPTPSNRAGLLKLWDDATEQINTLWPQIPATRFHEVIKMFGQWEGPVYWSILYFIDNETHHRGQGYVYLRSLGIEPPPFWDRV